MTYYIAKYINGAYICVNSDMHYNWFNSFSDIDPSNLYRFDKNNRATVKTIEGWLTSLDENSMTLVLTFTRESHPELFL